MPGFAYEDERDECDLHRAKVERMDAILANAYANGRRAGLQGLSTAGRPEDDPECREWLKGYLSGLAEYRRRAA